MTWSGLNDHHPRQFAASAYSATQAAANLTTAALMLRSGLKTQSPISKKNETAWVHPSELTRYTRFLASWYSFIQRLYTNTLEAPTRHTNILNSRLIMSPNIYFIAYHWGSVQRKTISRFICLPEHTRQVPIHQPGNTLRDCCLRPCQPVQ